MGRAIDPIYVVGRKVAPVRRPSNLPPRSHPSHAPISPPLGRGPAPRSPPSPHTRTHTHTAAAALIPGGGGWQGVHAMVVPGSGLVKEQAIREGLDKVLVAAGFDWREPGCSMCLAMNPDKLLRQRPSRG